MIASRDNLQIDAPELMTPADRARDTLVTLVMWVFYFYLWVPLISLFAWLLGFEFAYDVMVRSGGARALGHVLIVYAVIITVIFCAVTTWSLSNRLRYGKLGRRQPRPSVSAAQMADYFAVDQGFVESMRSSKTTRLTFDPDGRPRQQ